nr:phosducin-like protein 3 [Halyomorpha halys]
MPVPPSFSPFMKEQHLFKYSLSRIQPKKHKQKEFKFKPQNVLTTIEFPNYSPLEEEDFFKLIFEGKEAVVNFSRGDSYVCNTFHTYLKVLSYEYEEAEFYHIDTGLSNRLMKKLGIRINPTIVVILENDVRDIISGFEDFHSKLVVNLSALKARLAYSGVIRYGGIVPETPKDINEEFVETVVKSKLRRMRKQLFY